MTRTRLSKAGHVQRVYLGPLKPAFIPILGHGHTSTKAFHSWHSPLSVFRRDYSCCFVFLIILTVVYIAPVP